MKTNFSPRQLADPGTAVAGEQIRACVHCGFCTATCPTYALLGDERDSPRGRIYMIKDMLEEERDPSAQIVKHVDRCLSCLSCMTTCPSGVNYMHLVDHARAYIERRYRRPFVTRFIRAMIARILPYPRRLRAALRLARAARWTRPLWKGRLTPIGAMLDLAPRKLTPPRPRAAHKQGAAGRVALLRGCAEPVLRPEYQDAAARLLGRLGYEIASIDREVCCGALVHHMGREDQALFSARRNVDAWTQEIEARGLTAIIVTASGCGTTIKNYGFMLRNDPGYADKAARVSALARDISEFLLEIPLPAGKTRQLTVAYHGACSLQHGQRVVDGPKHLLARTGYTVRTPAQAHMCCGSAGTYNILQPELAGQLGDRKAAQLGLLEAQVIATGNIGCAIQIGARSDIPVVHIVELIDWALGGPCPSTLSHLSKD